jgi:hypothetical protein
MTNKSTKKSEDMLLSYDKMKEMVDSGKWDREITAPSIIGGTSNDSGKLPEGFKDTLREMKKIHPHGKGADHLV